MANLSRSGVVSDSEYRGYTFALSPCAAKDWPLSRPKGFLRWVLDKEEALRKLRRDTHAEPHLLAEHQALHRRLYAAQNRRIFVLQIAAHLAEEAGEVSRESQHKNTEELGNELADVGSWMFAIANRLGFEMTNVVWDHYPYECRKCHTAPCACRSGNTDRTSITVS